MLINELILERRARSEVNVKLSIRQQIDNIIKKHGGTVDDYWISSTSVDHLGFHGGDKTHPNPERTKPGKAIVVPTEPFKGQLKYHDPEYATYAAASYSGSEKVDEKYGLWFMPLKNALELLELGTYPYLRNFVFLVKLNDDAWLQPVNRLQKLRANLVGINPPSGKRKVGQFNPNSDIAVLFEPAYKIVGRWTRDEIDKNSRREQMGGIDAQKRIGQYRKDVKQQRRNDLTDLF